MVGHSSVDESLLAVHAVVHVVDAALLGALVLALERVEEMVLGDQDAGVAADLIRTVPSVLGIRPIGVGAPVSINGSAAGDCLHEVLSSDALEVVLHVVPLVAVAGLDECLLAWQEVEAAVRGDLHPVQLFVFDA
jgi:hypothetical protein